MAATKTDVPHNLEAEQDVLASLIIDSSVFPKVRAIIGAEAFFDSAHSDIFRACESLSIEGIAIDQVTLSAQLQKDGKLAEVGGPAYLSKLAANLPTSVHAAYYADIVKEQYQRRQLIELAGNLAKGAYGGVAIERVVTETLSGLLTTKANGESGKGPQCLKDLADEYFPEFAERATGNGGLRGLSTGFGDIDRAIDGLEAGKLYLVGARPSMGKTMLLLTIAKHVARVTGVLLFSLEQSSKSILERLALAEAGLDRYALRCGGATEQEVSRYWDAYRRVAKLPMWIDETAAITTSEASSRLMALKVEREVGAMLYDYIDLSGDQCQGQGSEELRIAGIAKNLRRIAKVCNIPVIAACQLNRELEHRTDKRPQLSDLRYSGSLEQVADVVMFLYRDEYYSERGMKDADEGKRNVLDVLISKNKDGPVGNVHLFYDTTTGKIASLEKKGKDS